MDILGLNKDQLLKLYHGCIDRFLTVEEVLHIASTLDAFWSYDMEAAKNGRPGLHAELKSKLHSNGFFSSLILLQHPNILKIMAWQMGGRIHEQVSANKIDWVAGIPDGATKLGEELAKVLGAKVAKMQKIDGKISMVSEISAGESLLLCEDFCTQGTGFKEAVHDVAEKCPNIHMVYLAPVIINRGGLKAIEVPDVGSFKILPVADHRIQDWKPEECPLCQLGSEPIKPKATDENWIRITTSQLE